MDSDGAMYMLLCILIMLSAFFSAAETTFLSVNKIRLKNYADNGNKKAETALKIADNYDSTLSTILVGNNVVNIASASVATVLFTKLIGESYGAAVSTVVMTILVLVFGEVLPKSFAKANAEKISLVIAAPLYFCIVILKPIVVIFVKLTEFAKKLSKAEAEPSVTEEELKYIIESIEEEGVLEQEESELVRSALEFDDITVKEILTPRVDIVAVEIDDSIDDAIEVIKENGYSRMPVYEKSIDKVVGIIRARDILLAKLSGRNLKIRDMIKDCLFIHKNMNISQLLNSFQEKNMHVAIVSDDYGGTMGLVTMEDVLEELVGDIWDEYDEVVEEFVEIGDNEYEISGNLDVYEMLDRLNISEKGFDCDYSTVGGWVIENLEKIPTEGDKFIYRNLDVTVTEVLEQRVVKINVKVNEIDEEY
ncbi:MAG: hemolysin family protein [Oscillospiraceae bacterium]